MSNTSKTPLEDTPIKKSAIVGRALGVAVSMFLFAVVLFIGIVVVAAKFATKKM